MVDTFEEDFDSNDEFHQDLKEFAKAKSPEKEPTPTKSGFDLSPLSPVAAKIEKVTLEDVSPPAEEIVPDKANQPSYLFTAEQLDMWLGSDNKVEPVKEVKTQKVCLFKGFEGVFSQKKRRRSLFLMRKTMMKARIH